MTQKTLWEILVPQYSNEGIKYELTHHRKWDEYVRSVSNGLTISDVVKGQWESNDCQVFIEPMIPVRIYCDKQSIDKIVQYTITHYSQKAVIAYEISSKVIFQKG
jgi:hypothetical protein